MRSSVHPVDEVLPAPKLLALGLQHVLVMYAGAVAVPLTIGRALLLPPEQVALLVNADLVAVEEHEPLPVAEAPAPAGERPALAG